jgi:putative endonuclease
MAGRLPRYYTGLTSNLPARLAGHNAGEMTYSARYRPWSVDLIIECPDERRAVSFERYLKSGSGVAFAQRHLCETPTA